MKKLLAILTWTLTPLLIAAWVYALDGSGWDGTGEKATYTGNKTITGNLETAGMGRFGVPSAQTIAAGNTVAADACGSIKQITASGGVTTDTTNTFTAPAAANSGCCMDVINIGAQVITLDENANFVSAGDVALGAGDTARVCSNGTTWYQISGSNN